MLEKLIDVSVKQNEDDVNTKNRGSKRLMPEHDAERTSLDAAGAMYARPKADPNKIREIETETRKEMQAKGATDEEIAKAIRERTAGSDWCCTRAQTRTA